MAFSGPQARRARFAAEPHGAPARSAGLRPASTAERRSKPHAAIRLHSGPRRDRRPSGRHAGRRPAAVSPRSSTAVLQRFQQHFCKPPDSEFATCQRAEFGRRYPNPGPQPRGRRSHQRDSIPGPPQPGGVQEWLNWPARKAGVPATVPWVRIPPPPRWEGPSVSGPCGGPSESRRVAKSPSERSPNHPLRRRRITFHALRWATKSLTVTERVMRRSESGPPRSRLHPFRGSRGLCPPPDPADTIFHGDHIVTMDPQQPTVEAVAYAAKPSSPPDHWTR